ncbi:hypothetical protein WMY93_017626 [Mugilogobius chulae]|uniref:Zona pellucida sperm-binding protein 3 n=1 Tax=Mugilogobius chulae TaxID=88201 RepID=A0AAW0NVB2_9GOBI
MGKQPKFNVQEAEKKCNLYLLLGVALFSLTSATETLPTFHKKTINDSTVKAPLQPHPVPSAVVQYQSDEAHFQPDTALHQDVSVTCGSANIVVRVRREFYGLGADPSQLTLGSCQSNGELGPEGDLLFTYPLTQCDGVSELLPGYLAYKFVLRYEPSPEHFPREARTVSVNIECRYRRSHYLHKLVIKPTWETRIVHHRLRASRTNFEIQLMDDTWDNPVKSRVFQLGETVNFQVTAPHLTPGRKLYINSCYVTPVTPKSNAKFTLIDNYGCLIDSKFEPGASHFISRTDKSLRFSIKAFQFVTDPDAEITMHCQLHVTSARPSHAHKSCTYTQERNNQQQVLVGIQPSRHFQVERNYSCCGQDA